MSRSITIDARWDAEAGVWIATSNDLAGLVVEADTWPAMIEEVRLVLPDLLELSGERNDNLSLTFRAEEHLDGVREFIGLCIFLSKWLLSRPSWQGQHEIWYSQSEAKRDGAAVDQVASYCHDILKKAGLAKAF